MPSSFQACLAVIAAWCLAGCASSRSPRHEVSSTMPATKTVVHGITRELIADQTWWVNLPAQRRVDASGLVRLANGDLRLVSDREPTIFKVRFTPGADAVDLEPQPGVREGALPLPPERMHGSRLDCEGIAADEQGQLYLCEESQRWVLRCNPDGERLERLPIDWSPVARLFSKRDRNASWEGIAVGGDKLYLANERLPAMIVVVDLAALAVERTLVVRPQRTGWGPLHYSDLSWFRGHLFVLLRHQRLILEVDPAEPRVLAEYSFAAIERRPELQHRRRYPTGVMEGLAVDAEGIWLVTDNNGEGRREAPTDRRPLLIRCRWPAG